MNSHGIVAIQNQEVTHADVERVIDAAKAVAIPADQKIIHILPQEFIIDSQEGIREPIGMSGVRLEAKVHMVTGAVSAAQNIIKCIQRCGLEVSEIILEQLASSQSVLTEDEKELGVCLIDIGGGTTDIAIFTEGAIRFTSVIPIAGDQVTNDIAVALRTPTQSAEQIKRRHACALPELADPDELVEVSGVGDRPGRTLTKRALAEVVGPRYEELFHLVKAELYRSGFEEFLAAGVVLTGGASNVSGSVELAEKIFKLPVRLGHPQYITGNSEVTTNGMYATSTGLLLYGYQQQCEQRKPNVLFGRKIARIKNWLCENF